MNLFSKPEKEWLGDPQFRRLDIGPLHAERDSITLKFSEKIFYNINISWPGYAYDNLVSGDGEYGPGKRLEFTIWPFGYWLIGLEKKNTFNQWSWRTGYWEPRHYRHFTWKPPRSWQCENTAGEFNAVGKPNFVCGAFRWHNCTHKENNG